MSCFYIVSYTVHSRTSKYLAGYWLYSIRSSIGFIYSKCLGRSSILASSLPPLPTSLRKPNKWQLLPLRCSRPRQQTCHMISLLLSSLENYPGVALLCLLSLVLLIWFDFDETLGYSNLSLRFSVCFANKNWSPPFLPVCLGIVEKS